jgi:hypothetical protein
MKPFRCSQNLFFVLLFSGATLALSGCFPCLNVECEYGVCNKGVCDCFDGFYGSECQFSIYDAGYDCVAGSCVTSTGSADYASYADCLTSCGSSACQFNQFTGTANCNAGSIPVASNTCCPEDAPYYCPETNLCYYTCESADASCSSTVVRGNTSGGTSAGYICSSGNCIFVSSGASYSSISACQSSCGQTTFSLNGQWLAPSGTGISISGQSGAFYAFSSNWMLFVNNGTVSNGSLKIRNISQINPTTWSCQVLFLHIVNGVPQSVQWSVDGTLTMTSNGSSITASATSPFGGNTGSETYNRQ